MHQPNTQISITLVRPTRYMLKDSDEDLIAFNYTTTSFAELAFANAFKTIFEYHTNLSIDVELADELTNAHDLPPEDPTNAPVVKITLRKTRLDLQTLKQIIIRTYTALHGNGIFDPHDHNDQMVSYDIVIATCKDDMTLADWSQQLEVTENQISENPTFFITLPTAIVENISPEGADHQAITWRIETMLQEYTVANYETLVKVNTSETIDHIAISGHNVGLDSVQSFMEEIINLLVRIREIITTGDT